MTAADIGIDSEFQIVGRIGQNLEADLSAHREVVHHGGIIEKAGMERP